MNINRNIKKFLRLLLINFPYLQETTYTLKRFYRNSLKIPAEEDFHALALFPDDNVLYLDVGANRGQSVDAILMKTKNSRIQLFEPNPLLYQKLRHQYGNNKKLVVNNFGLGDKKGEYTLYVPFYKKWMFDGFASFEEENAREWLKDGLFFSEDRHLSVRKIKCHIRQLDELELAPFLVKLDIQGYEFHAIKGGLKTIKAYEPILLVELPDQQIINYLKKLGYQSYAFTKGTFVSGAVGRLNTFFMTESKSTQVKKHIVS